VELFLTDSAFSSVIASNYEIIAWQSTCFSFRLPRKLHLLAMTTNFYNNRFCYYNNATTIQITEFTLFHFFRVKAFALEKVVGVSNINYTSTSIIFFAASGIAVLVIF